MEKELLTFLDFLGHEYNYSKNTVAAYRNDLLQFMRYIQAKQGGAVANTWGEISEQDIRDYVDYMKNKQPNPLAASSIARKVAAIKSFYNYLFARNLVALNPSANIDSPKVKKRLPETLSAEDVESLLQAPTRRKTPKHLRDTALLRLLYSSGMRVTEMVSLSLDDLDLQEETLHSPEDTGEIREIPLDDETQVVLQKYLNDGRPYLLKNRTEQALFLNHRGKQLTRQGLWLIIKAYAKEANLNSTVTPHTLRHSFASHKLTSGSDLEEVQRLLGHANISTTQIYSQLEKQQKATV